MKILLELIAMFFSIYIMGILTGVLWSHFTTVYFHNLCKRTVKKYREELENK